MLALRPDLSSPTQHPGMLAFQPCLDQFATSAKRSREDNYDDHFVKRLRCGPTGQSGACPPAGFVKPTNVHMVQLNSSAPAPWLAPTSFLCSVNQHEQPTEQPSSVLAQQQPADELPLGANGLGVHESYDSVRCGSKRTAEPVPWLQGLSSDPMCTFSEQSLPLPPKRFKANRECSCPQRSASSSTAHVELDDEGMDAVAPTPLSTCTALPSAPVLSGTCSSTCNSCAPTMRFGVDSEAASCSPLKPDSVTPADSFAQSNNVTQLASGGELVLYRPVEPYTHLQLAPEVQQLIARQLPVSGVHVVACPGAQGAIISYTGREQLSKAQIEAFWHANPMYLRRNLPSCTIEELDADDEADGDGDASAMEM